MSATISVTKEKIKKFFEDSQQKPLLIPDYQRPYEWEKDEIITLFDDLKDFAENERSNTDEYFLGAIVHYNNDDNQREVIDGHQRLVSITLLLRAIYDQLESMSETNAIIRNKLQIEPLIWKTNMTSDSVNKSEVLIRSNVIGEETEKIFLRILEIGTAEVKASDLYSRNYNLLRSLYKDYCSVDYTAALKFIEKLLNQVIILPIQAESQDMALTIFSTLNDRGKPLTEADILKAKIYKSLDENARKIFIGTWQNLEDRSMELEKDVIEDVFAPYMFYNRALDGWSNVFYSGVRKYFLNEKPAHLCDPNLMSNCERILNFWAVANQHVELNDEPWSRNVKVIQALEILELHPHDFWKHAAITYYLANRKQPNFDKSFLCFLRKLISQFVPRCFIRRAIDAIKVDIIRLNVCSIRTLYPDVSFKPINGVDTFTDMIKLKSKNTDSIKMLLKIIAYADPDQTSLLPDKLQIEHIYPRKWADNYDLNGFTPEKINDLVDTLGNLTLFEKKHNIRAGNEYFAKKKKSYRQSKVAMTQKLAERHDFLPENIITRTDEMNRQLKKILETWSAEYDEAKRAYDQQHRAEEPI